MSNRPIQVFVVVFVLLIILLAALYNQTRSLNHLEHSDRLNLFLQLRSLMAETDKEILLISRSGGHHYDYLVSLRHAQERLKTAFLQPSGLFDLPKGARIRQEAEIYWQMQQQLDETIEEIKHYAAVMRNGLLYLPHLAGELVEQKHPQSELATLLLSELYRYHEFGDTSTLEQVQQRIAQIEQLNAANPSELMETYLHHTRQSLRQLQRVHRYVQEYLVIDLQDQLGKLETSYHQWHLQRTVWADRYSFALLVITVLLLLVLLLTFRRLQRATYISERAHARLKDAVSSISEAFALFDRHGKLLLHNQTWLDIYPWLAGSKLPDWAETISRNIRNGVKTDSLPVFYLNERHQSIEQTLDGRWFQASNNPTSEGGLVCIRTDITESKQVEEKLRMVAAVFKTANEGIVVADADARIKAVNPAFSRITGYAEDEVVGKNPRILSSGRHDAAFYRNMWESLQQNDSWSGEIWNRRKNGKVYPEWLSIAVLRDAQGKIIEFVSVFSDITQRKEAEAHIRYQAYYDALTGLPNRSLLTDRMNMALTACEQNQHKLALMFIDLDRFKNVNDTLGHEFGDELLVLVAKRISRCIGEGDTLARFGGDEFVLLQHRIHADREATLTAEKIIRKVGEPFHLAGREITIGASIGIAIFPDDATTADALLRNADLAMYRAKNTGRNQLQFFTPSLQEQANQLMEIEQDLHTALEQQQFSVHYQPLINTRTGRMVGVEALLRWNHPQKGNISPERFIPLAEDTGLIGPIGLWVVETASAQVQEWNQQGWDIYLSVNLSGCQRELGLNAGSLQALLAKTGLPARQLTLEITESLLMDSSSTTYDWLQGFKELGCRLAIDDFGTGYSSLSYLKRFPIDLLKIDREFIRDLTLDHDDGLLVEAIIAMANSMKLQIIAEGVETDEHRYLLYQLGCQTLQGFYFSPPLPADQLQAWVGNYQSVSIEQMNLEKDA